MFEMLQDLQINYDQEFKDFPIDLNCVDQESKIEEMKVDNDEDFNVMDKSNEDFNTGLFEMLQNLQIHFDRNLKDLPTNFDALDQKIEEKTDDDLRGSKNLSHAADI